MLFVFSTHDLIGATVNLCTIKADSEFCTVHLITIAAFALGVEFCYSKNIWATSIEC